jgi:hypothetical protein
LLGALPRSYQVTPDIPDRRRATQQKEVRPLRPTASKRVSSPPVGTISSASDDTDHRIETASLNAAARPRSVAPPASPSRLVQGSSAADQDVSWEARHADGAIARVVCAARPAYPRVSGQRKEPTDEGQ